MTFTRFKPDRKISSSDISALSRPRVLYIEDEEVNWEIAQNELAQRFDLSRAQSAREAFHLISNNAYHLILLDIQLSGSEIDGITVARLLKGRYAGPVPDYAASIRAEYTPIIFVTAYTARYPKEELLEAGADDVITKPINFTHLSLAVARAWARGPTKSA